MDFLKSDTFLIMILIINIFLFLLVILNCIRVKNLNKKTSEFLRKLGDGKDIREDLNKYMDRIINLESGLSETNTYCKQLDKQLVGCVQKIGIVRYNAYKDSGSNLSFAVALLDEKNDGVVFNGIYSREMSSIYAKPISNGKSSYKMSEEENKAVLKAMNYDGIQKLS